MSLALRHDPQIPAVARGRIERIARELGYAKNPVVAQLMTELRRAQRQSRRKGVHAASDDRAGGRMPAAQARRDAGLVQLERRSGCDEWAGMDPRNDLAGEAAVDMLAGLLHNHETGVPPFPRAQLVGGSWTEGGTVRPLLSAEIAITHVPAGDPFGLIRRAGPCGSAAAGANHAEGR